MVKRITISIPDGLGELLQEYGSGLNVSKVCQEALSAKLERAENLTSRLKRTLTMEEVIERLRRQKGELENEYGADGAEYGAEFCKRADYADLRYAATSFLSGSVVLGGSRCVSYKEIFEDENLGDYFDEYMEDENLTQIFGSFSGYLDDAACHWWRGWCEAVRLFWDELQTKI